ncbi:hypothetical protein NX801_27730 [Streptomyces sp. LP05-1]|uniref:Uncharacterized protein n=1 Tax=Streptomyces pyxinae TaxID=2970734 RepID=A0ABT2CRN1_9ACTN|nr:hypothetical protein [Streptomyces sp. LP05-1]MCS0639361.1 hypothetical protein [Streptomyces sp. LP05-1]
MCGENSPSEQASSPLPALGTLLVDVVRERVGEFRGEWCGQWALRPLGGGTEWTADPAEVQVASPEQRIRAKTAYANARSRGEVL